MHGLLEIQHKEERTPVLPAHYQFHTFRCGDNFGKRLKNTAVLKKVPDTAARKGAAEMDYASFSQPVLREAGLTCVIAGAIGVEHQCVGKRRQDIIPDWGVGIVILVRACEGKITHIRTRETLQKPRLGA